MSHTTKILIGVSVLALAVLGANYMLFSEIRQKNERTSGFSVDIELELKKEQRLRAMKQLVRDTEEKRAQLNQYFIDGESAIVDFLERIESLGDEVGAPVTIDSVSPQETEDDVAYEHLRITLSTQGAWRDVFHLFSLIESLPYSIEVEKADFSRRDKIGGENASSPQWQASFVFNVAKLK